MSRYDRATVDRWARSHAEVARALPPDHLAQAAVHAVLARLRRCREPRALFAAYDERVLADFTLIRSLLPAIGSAELLWRLREAAFHLRWRELMGGPG